MIVLVRITGKRHHCLALNCTSLWTQFFFSRRGGNLSKPINVLLIFHICNCCFLCVYNYLLFVCFLCVCCFLLLFFFIIIIIFFFGGGGGGGRGACFMYLVAKFQGNNNQGPLPPLNLCIYHIPINDTSFELSVLWPSDTENQIKELRFSDSISLSFKTRIRTVTFYAATLGKVNLKHGISNGKHDDVTS